MKTRKCGPCRVAEQTRLKTKPQLAVEMFQDLENQQTLPFGYVVADSIYGKSPEFIEAVESCA